MKYRIWLSILLCVSILAGCSFPLDIEKAAQEDGDTLGLEPDFSYVVEEQTPNILVNQAGYLPEDSKVAILQGNDLQNVFYIYNAVSEQLVYEGSLEFDALGMQEGNGEEPKTESEKEEVKDVYLADFSEIKKPGIYYVYQPDLGYSYEFEIGNEIYDEVERAILDMIAKEENDTSLICYQLAAVLTAKELYPANILETEKLDAVCRAKIECLLRVQDSNTGNVYVDVSKAELIKNMDEAQKQPFISLAATAEFAGTMAMYALEMREVDRILSAQCQQAAEIAYNSIQNSLDNVGYDAGYFAAAHLYRLTGQTKYTQAISQYLTMKEEQKSYTDYDFSLFGDYAYLTVRYGSNLEWSELIMKKIMKQAEEISLSNGKNSYYVSEKREYNDIDGKLRDMSVLALVNYIITNHEYSVLQKNYLDFFMGRNPLNICFVDGFGTRNADDGEEKVSSFNCGLFYLLLQSAKL